MIRTLKTMQRQEREKFRIPRSVQDLIPIQTVYPDGIFQLAPGKFSKTYKFDDVNYAVASRADKESMFLKYSEILNSFDSGATTKITINNRKINERELEQNVLMTLKNDEYDIYREVLYSLKRSNL